MTLAHIGGMPFEEWLTPLLATSGSLAVALRATFRRRRQRP
ncbi:MAG TPA: hypothetical protein VEZ15_02690 [Acidimicrobiia bacterium]|jgi:hypothetical protein|nr:hypothetical protein [Acidimicrobiia bacterium]